MGRKTQKVAADETDEPHDLDGLEGPDEYWVEDGEAHASKLWSTEDLDKLARALEEAGYEYVTIDGVEWSFEEWGLSSSNPYDHPAIEQEFSAWAGGGMTDHSVGLHTIGDHWFESSDADYTHLGRFDDIADAVAASDNFGMSPGGEIVLGYHGSPNSLLALIADLGCDASDPDVVEMYEELDVSGILDSELVDHLELFGLLDLSAGHGLTKDEVAILDRRWRTQFADAPDVPDVSLWGLLERARKVSLAGDLMISDAIRLVLDGGSTAIAAFAHLVDALPIGSEPLEVTSRWVDRDSEMRGVTRTEALEARIAAFRSLGDHLAVWNDAILEVDDGDGFRDAVDVARDADVVLALLTAANPMAVELTEEENERRNGLLDEDYQLPLKSIGRSADGTWEEAGFAMRFGSHAIDIGQRFGQAAIYRVSPDGVDVVVLVGADPDDLDRLTRHDG